jgi:hypothetical protein
MNPSKLFAASLLLAGLAQAQGGNLTVIHGIPGLPAPVEVFANNAKLFSFDFPEVRGPLTVPEGTYDLEVRLQGSPVLGAKAVVKNGDDLTVVAHLKETSGIDLALFVNPRAPIAANQSRLVVRHLANAPTVDIRLFDLGGEAAFVPGLSNPNQISADVPSGFYLAYLYPAGQPNAVVGPVALDLTTGLSYMIHAVGDLGGGSFRLVVETQDLTADRGMLMASLSGTSCGGTIGIAGAPYTFDRAFQVTLTGAQAGGYGLLLVAPAGTSPFSSGLALDAIGAPGCLLYLAPTLALMAPVDAFGNGQLNLTLPLEGASLFRGTEFQFVHTAPAANALGLLFTGSLTLSAK